VWAPGGQRQNAHGFANKALQGGGQKKQGNKKKKKKKDPWSGMN
jgi:hypothetical protein